MYLGRGILGGRLEHKHAAQQGAFIMDEKDMSIWLRFFEKNRKAHGLSELGQRVLAEFDSPEHLAQVVKAYRPDAEILEDFEPFGFTVSTEDTDIAYYVHRKPGSTFFTGIMQDKVFGTKQNLFETNHIYLAVWLCLSHSIEPDGWRWDTKALLNDDDNQGPDHSFTVRLLDQPQRGDDYGHS